MQIKSETFFTAADVLFYFGAGTFGPKTCKQSIHYALAFDKNSEIISSGEFNYFTKIIYWWKIDRSVECDLFSSMHRENGTHTSKEGALRETALNILEQFEK